MVICRQKERRLEEEKLRKVKTLGEAADDVDDVSAWINKSRALEEKAKTEARAKALKATRALEEQVCCTLQAWNSILELADSSVQSMAGITGPVGTKPGCHKAAQVRDEPVKPQQLSCALPKPDNYQYTYSVPLASRRFRVSA